MIGKGIFEFDVDGRKIGFKFGMYAAAITEKEAGCTITELFQRIHGFKPLFDEKGEKVGQEPIPGLSSISLLQYFYGGAVAYSRNEQLTVDEVGDMLDIIGIDKAYTTFSESIQTYLPKKKQETPETRKRRVKSQPQKIGV
jgi:hypothetical protein